jgi:hypothetical protein
LVGTALSVAALPNKINLHSTPVKGSQTAELSEKKKGNFPANQTLQFKAVVDILRICCELLEVLTSISSLKLLIGQTAYSYGRLGFS